MKRKNILQFVRQTMRRLMMLPGLCILALLIAACTQDELADAGGTALPEGTYPLTFSTAVEGLTVTRAATAEGQWTTGDKVAVKVGNDVRQYTPASTGASVILQAASGVVPFYWQKSGETKTVNAWYCGDGSTATGQSHASALPATWTVKSDQNTDDGYQQSDFLYAAAGITFAGRSDTPLTFYHQTTRVVVNIKNAEVATSAGQIRSVTIGNAGSLALSGGYTAPGANVTAGTWDISSATMGSITPKSITAAGGCLKSYAALVIPQDMQGKKFIAVTLNDGNTYYYIPAAGAADLQSGKQHTYNITVKHGYLEVVEVSTNGAWGDGTVINTNAAPEFTVSVADEGYANGHEYDSTFGQGNQIGLFAVKDHQIMSEANNLCLTAKPGNGGLVWTDANGYAPLNFPGVTYYAYYPYRAGVTGNPSAYGVKNFFATLISNWNPDTNQGDFGQHLAQDLMVAEGRTNGNNLSFSMQHQMSLVIIKDFPRKKYVFTNTSPYIPDYITDVQETFTGFSPCRIGDTYRYLVKPSNNGTLSGTYTDINGVHPWSFTNSFSAGRYKDWTIAGGTTTISHNLQAGDFYMNDGSLVAKGTTLSAEQKTACLGLVIEVGRHSSDVYDNYKQKKNGSHMDVHGYVVAIYNSGARQWSPNITERVNPYNDDKGGKDGGFCGYPNTQWIIDAGGDNLQDNFPAAYYATVDYETKHPAPCNSSGWFFPSSAQLCLPKDELNRILVQAGWHKFLPAYWSSSEKFESPPSREAPQAYVVTTLGYGVMLASKKDTYDVRSFLAF